MDVSKQDIICFMFQLQWRHRSREAFKKKHEETMADRSSRNREERKVPFTFRQKMRKSNLRRRLRALPEMKKMTVSGASTLYVSTGRPARQYRGKPSENREKLESRERLRVCRRTRVQSFPERFGTKCRPCFLSFGFVSASPLSLPTVVVRPPCTCT
jgi:hypothetical protein